jgi:hypothetical protein
LNGLPVEDGPDAEEDADGQRSDHAQYPDEKSDKGGGFEFKSGTKRREFRKSGDLEALSGAAFGTSNSAGMAVEGTDDEFGSAAATGGAAFEGNDYLGRGRWRWGAPKFMLSLIGCGCHKEFFL